MNKANSRQYKYSELDQAAKVRAMTDYLEGWLITHPNEVISTPELDLLCHDTDDDVLYDEHGNLI